MDDMAGRRGHRPGRGVVNAARRSFRRVSRTADVLEGRLQEDRFAASVSGVAHDPETAPAVYSDVAEFFAKTYPTEGLQEMVVNAMLALPAVEKQPPASHYRWKESLAGSSQNALEGRPVMRQNINL
jgi:Predicted ATPase (AAA+ superfamily)